MPRYLVEAGGLAKIVPADTMDDAAEKADTNYGATEVFVQVLTEDTTRYTVEPRKVSRA